MNLIIDGNNLAHRCKHKFSLSNHGVDVSVTYGFLKVLSSLMAKFDATSTTVAWDYGIPKYRREMCPTYKVNRTRSMDDGEYADFNRQLEELHKVLPDFGILSLRKPYTEADDIMYQASRLYDGDILIITADADMLQAVRDNVKVYSPNKDTMFDVQAVEELTGVPVHHYVAWRALQGDSSDNIDGVYGIGPATATKLFNKYGSLYKIIEVAKNAPDSKVMDKIAEFGEDAIRSNIMITALHHDKTKSIPKILRKVDDYYGADTPTIRKYLLNNAFMSLMTPNFMQIMIAQLAPVIKELW